MVSQVVTGASGLAAQRPLLEKVDTRVSELLEEPSQEPIADLDELAEQVGADISERPVAEIIPGDEGLKAKLTTLETARASISQKARSDLEAAAEPVVTAIAEWKAKQADLEKRLDSKRKELEEQGLKVQTTAIVDMAKRLNDVQKQLVDLRKKMNDHVSAREARAQLVKDLHANRDALYQARRATMRRIVESANHYSDGLEVHVSYERRGINQVWRRWLTEHFGFKEPRVSRISQMISPHDFATNLLKNESALLELSDADNSSIFTAEGLAEVRQWSTVFELEMMLLEDRPRINVKRPGDREAHPFNKLSAGQQRSVLLSLLLCAERSEPLVLDQPEDHLDGQYIAGAVVRHLEAAKERRQVIIATHSANLVVLGDSELVIPMHVSDGHGYPDDVGAVDRQKTRDRVCALLEGGSQAYKKRGERYGFQFRE